MHPYINVLEFPLAHFHSQRDVHDFCHGSMVKPLTVTVSGTCWCATIPTTDTGEGASASLAQINELERRLCSFSDPFPI